MRVSENSVSAVTRLRSMRMRACSLGTTKLNVVDLSFVAFNALRPSFCSQVRQCYSRFPCRLKEAVHDANVLDVWCRARCRRLSTSAADGLPELRSKKSAATNLRSFCACGDAWCRRDGHSV